MREINCILMQISPSFSREFHSSSEVLYSATFGNVGGPFRKEIDYAAFRGMHFENPLTNSRSVCPTSVSGFNGFSTLSIHNFRFLRSVFHQGARRSRASIYQVKNGKPHASSFSEGERVPSVSKQGSKHPPIPVIVLGPRWKACNFFNSLDSTLQRKAPLTGYKRRPHSGLDRPSTSAHLAIKSPHRKPRQDRSHFLAGKFKTSSCPP